MSTYEVGSEGNRKRQSRTGKIARLPHDVREEVNRRLRDNQPGETICKWINGLPAAKAVCKEFAKRNGKKLPITTNHLSEWRRGGYQDWLREQQMLESTREMARWSAKLAKESGGDLSEGAAVLLSGQLLKLLQGMAHLENIQGPTSNIQNRMDNPPEPCAPPHPDPMTRSLPLARPAAGLRLQRIPFAASQAAQVPCSAAERETAGQRSEKISPADGSSCCGQDPPSSDFGATRCPRSGTGEAEQMEASVRVLRELVKCLWGIRNGDHNKVRLAQVDRKLAQRDKMIALEREKYDDEQAEIAAKKREEEKRKKQEDRKRRRVSRLSDAGKIDLLRGKLFGPEKMIEEREHELQKKQKELELLKTKFGIDGSSSCEEATEAAGQIAGTKKEDGELKIETFPGSGAGNASGAEPIRVNTSPSDQSQEKDATEGGLEERGTGI